MYFKASLSNSSSEESSLRTPKVCWHTFHEVPVLLDQVEAELEEDGAEDQGVDAIV